MKRFILTLLIVYFFSFPVFGKKKPKVKVIDFTQGDVIQTEYLKPNQMSVEALHKRRSKSFIKIRTSFLKEIIKSAEDF